MKGSPDAPECGYSRVASELLKIYEVSEFSYVNVNENPEMKEIIKDYSDWPTFPQLYVKGKLVGGADILLEKHKNDLLKIILK